MLLIRRKGAFCTAIITGKDSLFHTQHSKSGVCTVASPSQVIASAVVAAISIGITVLIMIKLAWELLFKCLVALFKVGVLLFQSFDMFFKKLKLGIYQTKVISECGGALCITKSADKASKCYE